MPGAGEVFFIVGEAIRIVIKDGMIVCGEWVVSPIVFPFDGNGVVVGVVTGVIFFWVGSILGGFGPVGDAVMVIVGLGDGEPEFCIMVFLVDGTVVAAAESSVTTGVLEGVIAGPVTGGDTVDKLYFGGF